VPRKKRSLRLHVRKKGLAGAKEEEGQPAVLRKKKGERGCRFFEREANST
jgi:hypothetical protein